MIFGRELEIKKINEFLNSEKDILHITGKPGTGKTYTVNFILNKMKNEIKQDELKQNEPKQKELKPKELNKANKRKKLIKSNNQNNQNIQTNLNDQKDLKKLMINYEVNSDFYYYLNFFQEENINLQIKKILKSNCKILVIDEFDNYYNQNKKECLKNIILLKNRKIKIITISNDLRMGDVKFNPYSSKDIMEIVKQNTNIVNIIDDNTLKYMVLKYGKNGDLRALLKKVQEFCSKKNLEEGEILSLNIKDVIEKENNFESQSIHHDIIYKIKIEGNNKIETYKKYIKECEEMNITALQKVDFNIIYDIY